ncbi:MAG: PASTA domain-containing protein [Gemmatimonadales bacterium]
MSRPSRRTIVRTANFALVVLVAAGVGYVVLASLTGSPLLRRNVEVPDLRGMKPVEALQFLSEQHLRGRVADEIPDTAMAAGMITTQEPLGGSKARRGTMVNLTVSAGPVIATVPDVTEFTVERARAAILSAGLSPGRIDTVADTMSLGMIISTSPAAGWTVRRGSSIAITVSAGQADIAVPQLDGMTLIEATARLDSAGLVVGLVRRTDQGRPGVVQGQRPAAGAMLTRGGKVELIISEEIP